MRYYKYIHFLWANELKFNAGVVNAINSDANGFVKDDHLFVTPNPIVKEAFWEYTNVVLDNKDSRHSLVNKYAANCDWIFSHGLTDIKETLLIKREYLKKIVWRSWGGARQKSVWDIKAPFNSIKNKIGDIVYYHYMHNTFDKSAGFGISNIIDVLDLAQWGWNKNVKLLHFGYPTLGIDEMVENAIMKRDNNRQTINILVGHQGDSGEHQVDFVKKILNYKVENIKIYLPLSYGDKNYISQTIDVLEKFDDNRIVILKDLMPKANYLELLSNMDIAIFDGKSSMALGNIGFLLHFRKKIFINEDGIIKKAFDHDHLPYGITYDIGKISYDEFSAPVDYGTKISSDISFQTYQEAIDNWHNVLHYLDRIK